MVDLQQMGQQAKQASYQLATLSHQQKQCIGKNCRTIKRSSE